MIVFLCSGKVPAFDFSYAQNRVSCAVYFEKSTALEHTKKMFGTLILLSAKFKIKYAMQLMLSSPFT